jgi:AcrR family transcriptional regulator
MPPRAVTTEQVLAAADRLARRHGIEAVTTRKLCEALHVTAPSLYVHFSSKDELMTRLVDDILSRVDHPGPEHGDWIARLRLHIVSVYDEVAPYPGLAALIARQLPSTPSVQRTTAFVNALFRDAAVPRADWVKVMSSLVLYTWGHLLFGQTDAPLGASSKRISAAASRERYLWGLDNLLAAIPQAIARPVSTNR